MRISDWSSDVCSSDLKADQAVGDHGGRCAAGRDRRERQARESSAQHRASDAEARAAQLAEPYQHGNAQNHSEHEAQHDRRLAGAAPKMVRNAEEGTGSRLVYTAEASRRFSFDTLRSLFLS